MIWKDIKGWEGLYQINRKGNIRSLPRWTRNGKGSFMTKGRRIKTYYKENDYECVRLSRLSVGKTYYVHKLIGIHFISNPKRKKHVNHKDCNRRNNLINNLEWSTKKEDVHHSIRFSSNNICRKGEDHGSAILTTKDVLSIRRSSMKGKDLAVIYGVARSTISSIIKRRNWSHV